jgi:putative isomerase
MANVLNKGREADIFLMQAVRLKNKIQSQFFDEESQWFYDTSLDGEKFIKIKGCEGWTSLWAGAASNCQAEALRNQMMDTAQFFTRMPFPTLCPHHPAFEPESGYWRGPVWLDQAFFAVKGLRNYGFCDDGKKAVDKLINNAEGLIQKGPSIRENYNPVNGQGLEAENFSWSAASFILMMMDDS